MSDGLTIILSSDYRRKQLAEMAFSAPTGSTALLKPPARTIPQNSLMWAALGDLARAKPEGRNYPVHVWKALAMDFAGCKPQWERSLDGQGIVCVGYKSSRLTKAEFSDVIEAINSYAAEHGVPLGEEATQRAERRM